MWWRRAGVRPAQRCRFSRSRCCCAIRATRSCPNCAIFCGSLWLFGVSGRMVCTNCRISRGEARNSLGSRRFGVRWAGTGKRCHKAHGAVTHSQHPLVRRAARNRPSTYTWQCRLASVQAVCVLSMPSCPDSTSTMLCQPAGINALLWRPSQIERWKLSPANVPTSSVWLAWRKCCLNFTVTPCGGPISGSDTQRAGRERRAGSCDLLQVETQDGSISSAAAVERQHWGRWGEHHREVATLVCRSLGSGVTRYRGVIREPHGIRRDAVPRALRPA